MVVVVIYLVVGELRVILGVLLNCLEAIQRYLVRVGFPLGTGCTGALIITTFAGTLGSDPSLVLDHAGVEALRGHSVARPHD